MKLLEIRRPTLRELKTLPEYLHWQKIADDLAIKIYHTMATPSSIVEVAFFFHTSEMGYVLIADNKTEIDQFQKNLFIKYVKKELDKIIPGIKVKATRLETRATRGHGSKKGEKSSAFYIDFYGPEEGIQTQAEYLPRVWKRYTKNVERVRNKS